jgi:hypothetical protein
MSNPRAYFHDRLVLLFLTINSFLVVLCTITVLYKLGDQNAGYIAQYRSNLGLDGFKVGGVREVLSFIAFAILAFIFQLFMSIRMYHIRKHVSQIILILTSLLLIFTLIVSNALLVLR